MPCDLQRRGSFQWGQGFNICQCLAIWLNLSEREDYLVAAGLWKFQAWTEFLDEQMGLYCQTSLKLSVNNSHGSSATDGQVCEHCCAPLSKLYCIKSKAHLLILLRINQMPLKEGAFLYICSLSCMVRSITHLLAILHFLDQACKICVCSN